MTTYVYDFSEGSREMAALLGDKGAGLAEMTGMGLPVPPGFTVTTEACRSYLATGALPDGFDGQLTAHLAALELATGKQLGQVGDPLLLSVRTGDRFSAPGVAETVLDIGLDDYSVLGLGKGPEHERFAWDSYRRLVQMFGTTVMGVDGDLFAALTARVEKQHAVADDSRLDVPDLIRLVESSKDLISRETGEEFPQDPAEQLRRAVRAAFSSWNGERARTARRRSGVPEGAGTAVVVQRMVFGNLGPDSGSGVAVTRDPATGGPGLHGSYLPDAQGEDVVAGVRDPLPLRRLADLHPAAYQQLSASLERLEARYREPCYVEFTIEDGTLWLLETRVGARAAWPASP